MSAPVPLGEAARTWARIGWLSFGGPAGQIALMHRVLVEEKRWISEERYLHALNYCMLLPGPEAQQLATYVGWILHGTRGGLVAGLLFILPGALCVLALSALYAALRSVPLVEALFFGLQTAVLAIVLEATLRIGRRVLRDPFTVALAAGSFVAIFFLGAPFPWIVLGAGLLGLARGRSVPALSSATTAGGVRPAVDALLEDRPAERPGAVRTLRVVLTWTAIWLAPFAALALLVGPDDLFVRLGLFFGKAAVVTFGGAYAALGYVAQHAVDSQGWLTAEEMLDGLGLAETTPGPLILVLQFVGFMAGHHGATGMPALLGGVLGALVTLWATFAPCFLWIFAGAPHVERLRGDPRAAGALTSITAAVVGVILNLAVWFGLHVLFGTVEERDWHGVRLLVPELATVDPRAVALSALAAFLLFRTKAGMLWTLAVCAVLGGALELFA